MSIYVVISFGILAATISASLFIDRRSTKRTSSAVAAVSAAILAIGIYVTTLSLNSKPTGTPPLVTVTKTVPVVQTPSATDTPSETESALPTVESSAAVLQPGRQGAILTLADFFNPDSEWQDGRFDVSNRRGIVAIERPISACSPEVADLELRLANFYKSLTFSVGQANDSQNSDKNLRIIVFTNGRKIISRTVQFNSIQKFDVPVSSVNSVIIDFSIQSETECSGSVNALLISPTIR
jgi:hypothetical protein